jgi:transcription elongation GreA/GreB family factor
MDKKHIHEVLTKELIQRISSLQAMLDDTLESTAGETKSTAGDKHETARAMAQLEQEKLGGQIVELNKLKDVLHRLDPSQKHEKIQQGSLIETTIGLFYLSVGIGQLTLPHGIIFCMTPMAPFGKVLLGKKTGDQLDWQGKTVMIKGVY